MSERNMWIGVRSKKQGEIAIPDDLQVLTDVVSDATAEELDITGVPEMATKPANESPLAKSGLALDDLVPRTWRGSPH